MIVPDLSKASSLGRGRKPVPSSNLPAEPSIRPRRTAVDSMIMAVWPARKALRVSTVVRP